MTDNTAQLETASALNLALERYIIGTDGAWEIVSDEYPVTIGEISQHVANSYPPPISVVWNISTPLIVESFSPTTGAGQMTLQDMLSTQNPLFFGFYVAGQYTVTATIETAAGTGQVSHSFTVTAPYLLSLSSETGTVGITPNGQGPTFLKFGTQPGSPGIVISAAVRGDQFADGQLAFIQLANNSRFAVDSNNITYELSTNGQTLLDVGMTDSVFYQNVFQAISSGQQVNLYVTDSPAQQLPVPPDGWKEYIVGDNLETYQAFLMFRSNAAGAVWVPIGILNWDWGGIAENSEGAWVIKDPENQQDPTGEESYVFPSWTSNTAVPSEFVISSGNGGSSVLPLNTPLTVGDTLVANNQQFYAVMQSDGNLCVYRGNPQNQGAYMWGSQATGGGGQFFTILQSNGNLCTYYGSLANQGAYLWGTQALADGGKFFLVMQDDGNLCVYKGSPNDNEGWVWGWM